MGFIIMCSFVTLIALVVTTTSKTEKKKSDTLKNSVGLKNVKQSPVSVLKTPAGDFQ